MSDINKWRNTVLELLKPFTDGLEVKCTILEVGESSKRDIERHSRDAKSSSVITDTGGDTLVKKRIIGSHPGVGHQQVHSLSE